MRASFIVPIIIALVWGGLSYYDKNFLEKNYVFDADTVVNISREALAKHPNGTAQVILEEVSAELSDRYGDLVNKLNYEEWVFNNAGGAMGSMFILHASITEYLIFFGSAVGTEGHTGVHTAEDYFTILYGEQHTYAPGELEPRIYKPGDMNHLRRGDVNQYAFPGNSWALELAQGWIPPMLPFGLMDTLTSTLDIGSFAKTVQLSAVNMGKNLVKGKI